MLLKFSSKVLCAACMTDHMLQDAAGDTRVGISELCTNTLMAEA